MTTKYNGRPGTGVWFERDVGYIKVTVASAGWNAIAGPFKKVDGPAGFPAQFGVDGWTEKVIRILETRGTIIGVELGGPLLNKESNELHITYGHAAGFWTDQGVATEIKTEIDNLFKNDPDAPVADADTGLLEGKYAVIIV